MIRAATRALSALTLRGGVFVIAGVAVILIAAIIGQRDLLRIGVLLVALPLLSLLVTARRKVELDTTRQVEPSRIPAGDVAEVHLRVSNRSRLPAASVLIEEEVPPELGARARAVLDRVWTRSHVNLRYPVFAERRGRYTLGPVTARLGDPFGLVEVKRTASDTGTLLVTPRVEPLPPLRLAGEWSGSGESRPRAVASAGEEDATLREYRHGDDLRRVHWRASARFDELVVRREEQPWQSRTTVLLDNRSFGHAGVGASSSLEWAITAAASIGTHLVRRGYGVRLVTDDGGPASAPWHPGSTTTASGGAVSGSAPSPLLDTLAVVSAHPDAAVSRWPELLHGAEEASGLVVAILGRLTVEETGVVAALRHGSSAAFAILLDVPSWTDEPPTPAQRVPLTRNAQMLARAGWKVAIARRGQPVAEAWQALGVPMGETTDHRQPSEVSG